MSIKHKRNAIINLLERKLSLGGWSFNELGDEIEFILRHTPMIKKIEKDKNAPKKAKTAYIFFCQKNRPDVVEEMGTEASSVDVVRTLAERWRELKKECENGNENATNEMLEYKSQSEEDKVRFYGENAAFEKKHHG